MCGSLAPVAAPRGSQPGPVPRLYTLVPQLCPTDKPSSIQHQFFALHSTVLRTNRHEKAGFRKQFFRKFLGLHERNPFSGGATPSCTPARPKAVRRAQAPQCWDKDDQTIVPLRSYGTQLVLQHERTPGAATPLISARQHYAERIICYRQSMCHIGGSVKTVEVRIMQFSPQSSPEFLRDRFHL